jgi:hypothetical protein
MKTLTVLVIAQLLIVVVLLVKVVSLDNRLPLPTVEQPSTASNNTVFMPETGGQITTAPIREDQLRGIIREELAAQLEAGATGLASTTPKSAPDPGDAVNYQYEKEMLAQSLEYYADIGQITNAEMASLQTQIAGLRDEDRRQVLGQQARMLETGAIDGRL